MNTVKILYIDNDNLMIEAIEDHFKYEVDDINGMGLEITTSHSLTDYMNDIDRYDVVVTDLMGAVGNFPSEETAIMEFLESLRGSFDGPIILYTAMTGWMEYFDDPHLYEVQKGRESEDILAGTISQVLNS